MSDDELTRRVAEYMHADGDDEIDRILMAVSEGRMSESEALERGAPPEALEVFRPLGAGFETDTLRAISATLDASRQASEPAPRAPRRRVWWWPTLGLGLAAATAAILLVVTPTVPKLPSYAMTFEGGEKSLRGEQVEPLGPKRLAPDSQIEWVLRPEQAFDAPVSAALFAERANGALVELGHTPEIAESGAVRIATTVRALALPADVRALAVCLYTGAAPALPAISSAVNPSRPDGTVLSPRVRVFAIDVEVEAP